MPNQPEPVKWVLESRRLRLRQMRHDDLDVLCAIFSDPIVMRYFPAPWTRDEVQAAVECNLRRYQEDGFGLWMVVRKDKDVIGDCGLVRQELPTGSEIEVGYHFLPDAWGFGYATEAASRCLTHAFDVLKLPRVISLIRPENGPSRRVAERNGQTVAEEIEWQGLRHLVYALKREHWSARRRS